MNIIDFANLLIGLRPPNETERMDAGGRGKMTGIRGGIMLPMAWRFCEFVDQLTTIEDVEDIIFFHTHLFGNLSEGKIDYFLKKILKLIHQGTLDPQKASNLENHNKILACLVRISGMLSYSRKYSFAHSHDSLYEIRCHLEGYIQFFL